MTNKDIILLNKVQETLQNCTKNPERFLSVQEDIHEDLKIATKYLYDLAFKAKSFRQSKSEVLPELIIQDFDNEQIWQQIELENNEELSPVNIGEICRAITKKDLSELPIKPTKDTDCKESENLSDDTEEEQELISEKSDDDFVNNKGQVKRTKAFSNVKKRRRTTEVDDKFFKLDELDEFLQKEDKREMNADSDQREMKMNNDNSSSDEESIDLFNDFSDVDDEEVEDDEKESGKSLKYADFFDIPESDQEDQENGSEVDEDDIKNDNNNDADDNDNDDKNNTVNKIQQEKSKSDKKQVKFNLLNDSDESSSEENTAIKDQENETETTKSSLEARQERLKKRITTLEKEAISEKPWQLRGETTALNRPENSLLEEYVEFDSASRTAPIMTEETTMKLEDIILKRIKDKAWDDVEKKFKPVETPKEFKKKLIMNQEKSKESLAQIYENEYIRQREALNLDDKDEQEKEEPPEHIEIKQRVHDLFSKLDALSNYHYTPKMAKPEIKIISNIPAISMEEVAPVTTTDATLLAPEEIQNKQRGELIGKSERTKTDMKRERRKKKLRQHARAVNESKKLAENVNKKSLKNSSLLGKLKARNIINQESNRAIDKSLKSSTAFFSHLQDKVESNIKQKTNKNSKNKNKSTLSAVKLKL